MNWQLAANYGTLIEMNVVEGIDDARDVVQILRRGVTIDAGSRIDDVHRGSRGAEINARIPRFHVVFRVLPVQDEAARGTRHGILNQRARKNQPARWRHLCARLGHVLDAARRRIRESDVLEDIECGAMDAKHLSIGQWCVAAARHAGPDWAQSSPAAVPHGRLGAPRSPRGVQTLTSTSLMVSTPWHRQAGCSASHDCSKQSGSWLVRT